MHFWNQCVCSQRRWGDSNDPGIWDILLSDQFRNLMDSNTHEVKYFLLGCSIILLLTIILQLTLDCG